MKKLLDYVWKRKFLISFVVLTTIAFSACKKTLDTGGNNNAAGLMAFNLIPDKAAIGFAVSGNRLTTTPLQYTNYTGNYLPVYLGNSNIISFDANTDSSIASTPAIFEANKFYSVFALGNKGAYTNLVVKDNLDTLKPTGNALVRYINAIPDSSKPLLTITSNGTSIISINTPYASISDFKQIAPGNITVGLNNETNITATRTISLEKDKAYTVLLIGVPGATDSLNAVQIKYITNGTITP